MTTIARKWSHAPIVLGLFLILAGTNAYAEDDTANAHNAQQVKTDQQQQAFDQQYRLPPSYQGKYYPNDDTAIGYHGTTTDAQNDPGRNGSYYYYYY